MLAYESITLDLDFPLAPEGEVRLTKAIDVWVAMEREAQRQGACEHKLCMAYRLELFRRGA